MARDGGGGGPQAVEGRRVALRALLAGGDASSSAMPPAAAEEAVRPPGKGLLRGLRCTSAAAAQAFEPEAAAHASRPSADWRQRRKARGGGGAGVGGEVWCTPGIPFAAEASSVDCVVSPHPHQTTVGARRRAQAERPHREVRKKSYFCWDLSSFDLVKLRHV
jgi:hypothetical protein